MDLQDSISTVDVIIPNWNGSRCLGPCLSSLVAQTYPHMRVVVIDNGSTDDSLRLVRERFPGFSAIEVGFNSGFAAAVNRGIRETSGDYVALLNNDAVAGPDWVAKLVQALDSDRALGSCASRMLVMNRPYQINVAGLAFSPSLRACSVPIGWGALDSYSHHLPYLVAAPSGGAAMYRRSALDEVGLFDEDYFLYFEDFDMGIRLQLGGYDCLYVPDAVVYHDDEAIDRQHPDWILQLNRRNSRWTAIKCFPKLVVASLALQDGQSPFAAFDEDDEPLKQGAPREARLRPRQSLVEKRSTIVARTKITSAQLMHILMHPRRPYLRAPQSSQHFSVALVSHSNDIAGTEHCMLRLAKGMAKANLRPIVILPNEPGPLAEELGNAGIEFVTVPNAWWCVGRSFSRADRWALLARSFRVGWNMSRMLRQMGVETVGTTTSVVPTGAIAARLAGLRHVWHVREYYPTETLIPTLGIAPTMRLIRLLSNRVIVPSRKLAALFPDGAHDVEVLPEAIDAKYFDVPKVARTDARKALAIPSGRSLVAVVGTLEASKDQLTALRVLARLREQDMDVGLILCGGCYDLSYEKRLREEAQALCVADRVHFVGFQREVLLVYDASDVLLVTSTRESFGLTIIEAMARNVPVVATRCGGPEETIDDKDTGYLVGIADVNAMAQRIGTLLSDTALASSMTKKAKAFSLRFHPDENLEKTMRSYGFARTVQQ